MTANREDPARRQGLHEVYAPAVHVDERAEERVHARIDGSTPGPHAATSGKGRPDGAWHARRRSGLQPGAGPRCLWWRIPSCPTYGVLHPAGVKVATVCNEWLEARAGGANPGLPPTFWVGVTPSHLCNGAGPGLLSGRPQNPLPSLCQMSHSVRFEPVSRPAPPSPRPVDGGRCAALGRLEAAGGRWRAWRGLGGAKCRGAALWPREGRTGALSRLLAATPPPPSSADVERGLRRPLGQSGQFDRLTPIFYLYLRALREKLR